jgi:hypothetical protein
MSNVCMHSVAVTLMFRIVFIILKYFNINFNYTEFQV